jgi:carbonic anhydrase
MGHRHTLCTIGSLLLLTLPAMGPAEDHAPHWGYTGDTGPEHWGDLAPEYQTCKTGLAQSPLDITDAVPAADSFIGFRYRSAPLSVVNNGHTIQVNYPPGSYLSLGGKSYQLKQFHFHTPSEHSVLGQRADMSAHLVHEARDGELAVVAVAMNTGRLPNREVARIWRAMPAKAGREQRERISINAARLLPKRRSYFSYTGSLTTPPCTEGVRWVVMNEPITISPQQVDMFKAVIGDNARPTQPLSGRVVYFSR